MNKSPKLANLRRSPDSVAGVTMGKFSGRLPIELLDQVASEAAAAGITNSHRIRQIVAAHYAANTDTNQSGQRSV